MRHGKPTALAPRRPGFTLVELLVVIGIIVILMGILLPVLAGARDRARSTQCASNMRQVVLSLTMYESTYKVFPRSFDWDYGRYESANVPKTWVDMLVDLGFLKVPDLPGGEYGVLACPSVEESTPNLECPGLAGPHYGYNSYVNPPYGRNDPWMSQRAFWGLRSNMTKDPGEKILLSESWAWGFITDGRTTRVWRTDHGAFEIGPYVGRNVLAGVRIDFRHARGRAVNVAYLAGNVQLVYAKTDHLMDASEDVPSHPFSTYHYVRDP